MQYLNQALFFYTLVFNIWGPNEWGETEALCEHFSPGARALLQFGCKLFKLPHLWGTLERASPHLPSVAFKTDPPGACKAPRVRGEDDFQKRDICCMQQEKCRARGVWAEWTQWWDSPSQLWALEAANKQLDPEPEDGGSMQTQSVQPGDGGDSPQIREMVFYQTSWIH